ncbi:hypothetical protein KEM55_001259, partial [Ascosphaera atra]
VLKPASASRQSSIGGGGGAAAGKEAQSPELSKLKVKGRAGSDGNGPTVGATAGFTAAQMRRDTEPAASVRSPIESATSTQTHSQPPRVGANKSRSGSEVNPIGGASAFGWLKSSSKGKGGRG